MLTKARRTQCMALLEELDCDVLLLYGNGWRKDFFRCLIDLDYSGSDAIAGVDRSGDVFVALTDPWDWELARREPGISSELALELETVLRERPSLENKRVAVAGLALMEARFVKALEQNGAGPPRDATRALELIRMVKRPEEIAALERAAALADEGYKCFRETLQPGMAEYELVAKVEAFLKSHGAEDNFMLISSGGPEVRGMKPPTERRFQPGDCVATELTPCIDGYYAQICRTLVVGEPTTAQHEAFDIYLRAQQAARDMLRPGVNIADVARAENDVFREAGLGEYTGPKYTRVRGHGVGLFVDEYPHVLEETDCVVPEGMVLIPHPNTYLPTVGYMVFGDTLVVTDNGCRSLSSTEKKLFVS